MTRSLAWEVAQPSIRPETNLLVVMIGVPPSCAIFVPDLSFIGLSHKGDKRLPNSNVLVEYGYALAKIGEDRIVPVMNLHYGPIYQLPFDLKHRPIKVVYELSERSDSAKREGKTEELASRFQVELRLVFEGGSLFSKLSPASVKIARHLVESSETGWGGQGDYEVDELAINLGMEPNEGNNILDSPGLRGVS